MLMIEEIKLTHWDEPRRSDGTFIVTIIRFSEQRDGSIEVLFSDERSKHNHEDLVGFNKPFVAIRNIFNAIDAITTAFPGKYFYKTTGKRASVYKRYTTMECR